MASNQSAISKAKREQIRKKLLAEEKSLIEELKTKHKVAYDWLVAHNIDLGDLTKYTKNIAAALLLTTNQITAPPPQVPPTPPTVPPPFFQSDDPAATDKYEEKAKHVWALYGNTILAIAGKYHLDPQLIFATIMTESGGNPNSYRFEPHIADASYGLGQILYGTARGLGFEGKPQDMYDPIISIDLIARYHQRTRERYGEDLTPEQMSIVYNTGSLFKTPRAQHLERFNKWFAAYPVKDELASAETGGVE